MQDKIRQCFPQFRCDPKLGRDLRTSRKIENTWWPEALCAPTLRLNKFWKPIEGQNLAPKHTRALQP